MVYIFSKTIYRADQWARSRGLFIDQYRILTSPVQVAGLSFARKDRVVVVGIVKQVLLNAIQAALGKPDNVPNIEFYP